MRIDRHADLTRPGKASDRGRSLFVSGGKSKLKERVVAKPDRVCIDDATSFIGVNAAQIAVCVRTAELS